MQGNIELPAKAWIPLLWAKYNKLSEPLKEGFVHLAENMAKEANDDAAQNAGNTVTAHPDEDANDV